MEEEVEVVNLIISKYFNFSIGIVNPNPGTVIGDEITGGDDFYLVSIKTR